MAQPTADVREARRRLKRLRAGLEGGERAAAERAILRSLRRLRVFRRGARVALYVPLRGEVDVRPALLEAVRRGAAVYVPYILDRRRGRMCFVRWAPGIAQRLNRYGIAEPADTRDRVAALALDTVVMPVVGFDQRGNRLGMGAGFYDRALRRRRDPSRRWRRPRLVGIAFACQQVPCIPASSWDVPLDVIVTERGVTVPPRRPSATTRSSR